MDRAEMFEMPWVPGGRHIPCDERPGSIDERPQIDVQGGTMKPLQERTRSAQVFGVYAAPK